jgi:hypothetical protein
LVAISSLPVERQSLHVICGSGCANADRALTSVTVAVSVGEPVGARIRAGRAVLVTSQGAGDA